MLPSPSLLQTYESFIRVHLNHVDVVHDLVGRDYSSEKIRIGIPSTNDEAKKSFSFTEFSKIHYDNGIHSIQ